MHIKELAKYVSLMAEDRELTYWLTDWSIVIYGKDDKAVEVDFIMSEFDTSFNMFYFKNYKDCDVALVESFDLREPNSFNVINTWIDMIV